MDNASRHTAAPIINPSGYNLTGKKNVATFIESRRFTFSSICAGRDTPCVASLINVRRFNMRFTRSGYSFSCRTSLRMLAAGRKLIREPSFSRCNKPHAPLLWLSCLNYSFEHDILCLFSETVNLREFQ